MILDKLNHLNKLLNKFENKKGLCFVDNCDQVAIGSHTISEAKVLNQIQENDGKHGDVLLHLEDKPLINYKKKIVLTYTPPKRHIVRRGKSKSSVFYGFCNTHDTVLFRELDNLDYSNNSRINFLHAYRAFALYSTNLNESLFDFKNKTLKKLNEVNSQFSTMRSKFKSISKLFNSIPNEYSISYEETKPDLEKIENLVSHDLIIDKNNLRKFINKEFSTLSDKNNYPLTGLELKKKLSKFIDSCISRLQLPEKLILELEETVKLKIEENRIITTLFNSIYQNENYDDIRYLYRPIHGIYKFTGNFVFHLNNELFSLTFFPEFENGQTHVILSSISKNETFFNETDAMDDLEFKNLLSSIIINQGTNVFMSPSFWESLDKGIQNKILNKKTQFKQGEMTVFNENTLYSFN